MIVVVGRVRTDDDRRERLIGLGQALARASRAEAGCLDYRMLADTERPNHFTFVEEWADEASLQAHFRTPHIRQFMTEAPALLVVPPEVAFHSVTTTRDLGDVAQRP